MTIFLLALVLSIGICLWGIFFGWFSVFCALIFSTLCLLPRVLFGGVMADSARSGISGSEPRIMTYTVGVALVAAVGIWFLRPTLDIVCVSLFGVFLITCAAFLWPHSGEVEAGLVHFFTAIAAWIAGSYVSSLLGKDVSNGLSMARWILFIILIQIIIAGLQMAGLAIFPTNQQTAELVGGRVNGSFGHPTTLGKVVLLLAVLALPLTRSGYSATSRLATWAIALGFLPLILTAGRANFFATVILLIAWSLLLPSTLSRGKKFIIPMAVGLVGMASLGVWASRFEEDPYGSTRQHFNDVALNQIPLRPAIGSGPNTYVTAVGPYDSLTAAGWPVHNSVLLAAVEIGIVGAVLLFLPMVTTALLAARRRKALNLSGDYARAYIASIPAVAMVALTGWGMMSDMLPLWVFVVAFMNQQIRGASEKAPPVVHNDLLKSKPRR